MSTEQRMTLAQARKAAKQYLDAITVSYDKLEADARDGDRQFFRLTEARESVTGARYGSVTLLVTAPKPGDPPRMGPRVEWVGPAEPIQEEAEQPAAEPERPALPERKHGVIIVRRRGPDDYTAHIEGKPGYWAHGRDPQDAIGDLWLVHHEEIEATIRTPDEAAIAFLRKLVQFPGWVRYAEDTLEQVKSLLAKIDGRN